MRYQPKLLGLLLLVLILLATACSSKDSGKSAEQTDSGQTATNNDSAANDSSSSSNTDTETTAEETPDPLGKYDPPIEVTTVRIVNDTFKYKEGESIDNNVWTRDYLEHLGIKIKNLWVVSGDGVGGPGEQKMNVTIASGELPDIIPVNGKQLQQLIDADLIMDITDIYEKYASPLTKEILMEDGGKSMQSATFDGKLMAIPNTGSSMDGAAMIWVRSDWLKKLNLPEPKTMDDVIKIAEAFTKQDPDENGKDDTVGLAVVKDLMGGYAGLEGFFNGFHAYPNIWIKDESGQLVFGSIQPEVRNALAKLQEMFKNGLIDKEFGVKDAGKAAEAQGAGKNGLNFGQMWNPLFPLYASYENDPNAQWQSYPIVSIDDKPARPQVGLAVGGYYAIRKDAEHPEAAVKMLNLWFEKSYGSLAKEQEVEDNSGIEEFKYAAVQAFKARKNLDNHLNIVKVLRGEADESILNVEQKNVYKLIQSYLNGEEGPSNRWAYERVFGETGSFVVINKYVNENLFMTDEFTGAPTPTMVDKGSSLTKMQLEVFTKIIQGQAPIDAFDTFVADWKRLGGDDITREVNEWYKAKNQ